MTAARPPPLLTPTPLPGRLPQIGRNVLNAIYVFDPASPAALDIGVAVHQVGIRVGSN